MPYADLGARYEVLDLLGEGAMGQVYKARHCELDRIEAIKVLKPQVAMDKRFIARFRREARATNRLQHPNIVAMYDFGRLPDGRFYLSMEYADGQPLSRVVREAVTLPFRRALRISMQLAAAVEHAHSRGVVHRDLKPANLILVQHRGQEDVLKVLDFGVSKIISPDYNESIMVSQDGIVFGTPLYMAPEQFYKQPNDPRSDIYAIGCIAFELVAGRPPFTGKIPDVVRAHLERLPPAIRELAPGADSPVEFDDVLARCMAKEPEDRFQTSGDLLRALVMLEPTGLGDHIVEGDSTLVPEVGRGEFAGGGGEANSVTTQQLPDNVIRDIMSESGPSEPGNSRVLSSEQEQEEALRELAECLLDHSASDARLTLAIADLRAIEYELERCDIEMRELKAREASIEQAAREREGMLRFAIGELRFDRDQGGSRRRSDLDFQIRELKARLAETVRQSQVELAHIDDQSIAAVARRHDIEEKRRGVCARLEILVEEIIPAFDADLNVAPYIDRYLSMRDDAV